ATTSAESLALTADHLSHRQGEMLHTGGGSDLTLTIAQSLDNTEGFIAGNSGLDIIAGELTNTAGTLQALDHIRLDVGGLDNRQGELIAGDALAVAASGDIDNTQGQWLAERIEVSAAGLNNRDGLISAASDELRVRADELDNTSGRLEATGDLTLDVAESLTNQDGEIIHVGDGEANIAATRLEGRDGLIVSQGHLSLHGEDIVLDGATTSAESLALTADHLSHRQGEMLHTGDDRDLTLTIGEALDNTE
ncbi:hypothetical protein, partial [Vreelandella olivaria]|uniref:hypothetical protein n=1 Tax=Vreelandella olivaria TaxID=390919 RepID=UPI00201F4353